MRGFKLLAVASLAFLPLAASAFTNQELQVQIDALLSQVQALQQQLAAITGQGIVNGESTCNFSRNLYQGISGEDVRCFQRYLNSAGFPVAPTGPGSPGEETTYFGSLTRGAVSRWQAAGGISPTAGYFGPISRAVYIQLTAGAAPAQTTQTTQTSQTQQTTQTTQTAQTTQTTQTSQTIIPPTDTRLFCTKEALICPDGSVVGRNPSNNCLFDSCPSATLPTPPQIIKPWGIADLHPVATAVDSAVLTHSNVSWSVIRIGWNKLEPAEGQYDFSYIKTEVEAAKNLGRRIALRIIGGRRAPDWLKARVPLVTYTRTTQDGTKQTVQVPPPWHSLYEQRFRLLIEKIASEVGNNFDLVSACGFDSACGLHLGPDRTLDKWTAVGYSADVYLSTINRYVDFFAAKFPASQILFHLGVPFGDASITQSAVDHGKLALGRDRFVLFSENLKASFDQPAEGGSKRQIMIRYSSDGGRIGYQSVWSVTNDPLNANDCTAYESDDDCLWRAVNAGLGDGARYFELYEEDIRALPETIQKIYGTLKSSP